MIPATGVTNTLVAPDAAISRAKLESPAPVKQAGRAFSTTYQNTTGRALFVIVTVARNAPANTLLTWEARVADTADGALESANIVASVQFENEHDIDAALIKFPLPFVVPPGYYYRITGSALATVDTWVECFL